MIGFALFGALMTATMVPAYSQTTVVLFDFGSAGLPPTSNCTNAATTQQYHWYTTVYGKQWPHQRYLF